MRNGPTSRIVFRPVLPTDYPRLYEIESDPTTAMTWRYHGNLPSFEEYEPALWKQTQQIMVVEGRTSGQVVGYLQLHDVDPRAGNAWFSLYSGPEHRGSGLVMEGLRDTTLHPDGRQIAFNAGWKKYESWALDGLLAP